jgi:hypothetical protein
MPAPRPTGEVCRHAKSGRASDKILSFILRLAADPFAEIFAARDQCETAPSRMILTAPVLSAPK